MQSSFTTTASRLIFSMVFLFSALLLSAQTVLLNEGFENGKGAWIFSTAAGGNDFLIKIDKGYNSNYGLRCGTIANPNFAISPAITFAANKPYKISFMAYAGRVNTRKIEVFYNSTPALNGSETLIGTIEEVPATYTSFTLNLTNPPAGVKYIIFRGVIKGTNNTWVDLVLDDIKVVQTSNFIPSASFTQPLNGANYTAGQPLAVAVDASDVDGQITMVKLFYRGEYFGSVTSAPYQFSIPNLPLGNSSLYARAYDNSGDSVTTATITVTGINTPPSVTLTLPASNITILQADSVTFSATAVDIDGTIESVGFYVNNERVALIKNEPYTFKWADPSPGVYQVFAIATDNTGLISSSDTISITSNATSYGYIFVENFEEGLNNWAVSVNSGGNDWKTREGLGVNGTNCVRRKSTDKNFMRYDNLLYFCVGNYQVKVSAKASNATNSYFLQAGIIMDADTVWSTPSAKVATTFTTYDLEINNTKSGYGYFIFRGLKAGTSTYIELLIDDLILIGAGGEANIAPIVKIVSPTNTSEVSLNTPTTITSQAYDLFGSVAKVEYFVSNQKIGEATTSPFAVQWTPANAGVYNLKAIATDNEGKTGENSIKIFVNYLDRKVYDYVVSSYLGGEGGSGKVWGTKVLSDGVIVLACDWGTVIPEGAVLHLLNGATINSRGTIVRIAADGKKILSLTKISDYAVDLSIDNTDNIYVAAANKGIIKLNRLADEVIFAKTFTRNVYRVDAGKTGFSAVLARPDYDFDGKKWDKVTVYLLDRDANVMSTYGGASTYTNDVCIDEATQSVVVVGWRNISTNAKDNGSWLPVDIPGMKIFSFSGALKYNCYNWSGDPASPDWLNRPENNMADTRIARVSMGDDGLLYFMAEVSGGNHPLRYSPYDIMKKVRFVGGDNYHVLSNTGTEFHTFVGRMNLANGAYIEGQSFTARLGSGAGNTLEAEHGNVQADEDGRVYFTGSSASGTPLTRDVLPEIAYTGGAFIYIMNPTLQTRELVCRVVQKNSGHDIAVRKFANFDKTIVYAGSTSFQAIGKENQSFLYLKNPIQNTFLGTAQQQSGFFAVIGGTTPALYELKVNGVSKGMFAEGTKISLNAADYVNGSTFVRWSNAGNYITDSISPNTTFSMPGKNVNITTLTNNSTMDNRVYKVDITCYPNPAKNTVIFNSNSAQSAQLKIFDALGKLVYSTTINGSKTVDVSGFKNGIYVVNIDNRMNKKLVIQH